LKTGKEIRKTHGDSKASEYMGNQIFTMLLSASRPFELRMKNAERRRKRRKGKKRIGENE